ncbi:hypothetical protein DL771_007012 [Monosporascus sp. 5C6A]|nr:hypothetical protein DL771_007012 [Monosporascus sp. 5C6A]
MSPVGWYMALIASLAVGTWSIEAPIEGYGITELEWKVPVRPGQDPVILNGTVQQVHDQLLELNPEYDAEIATFSVSETVTFDTSEVPESGLERRDHNVCKGYPAAFAPDIITGINYLRGVPGTATNGPGPGNCGRVSCLNRNAIWWCNDLE